MTGVMMSLAGRRLTALPSGALWDAGAATLCVSDLHLGKSDRIARRAGLMLPPYDSRATLDRLAEEVTRCDPRVVVCLGDSFDDLASADALDADCQASLLRLQAGRRWIWIEGNHDPGPVAIGGTHLAEIALAPLMFRHIAGPAPRGEVSGHYHPKARITARGRSLSRRCFLVDDIRLILPAYGTYTGGLSSHDAVLASLMGPEARAILIGPVPVAVPMPR